VDELEESVGVPLGRGAEGGIWGRGRLGDVALLWSACGDACRLAVDRGLEMAEL
jgi:hypothetical protein